MIFIWYFHRLSVGTFYNKSSFGFWGLHCTMKTNVGVNTQRKNTSAIDPQTYQSTFLPSVDSQILFFIWNLLEIFFNIILNYWLKFNIHFSNTYGIYPQLMELPQAKEREFLNVHPHLKSELIFILLEI